MMVLVLLSTITSLIRDLQLDEPMTFTRNTGYLIVRAFLVALKCSDSRKFSWLLPK